MGEKAITLLSAQGVKIPVFATGMAWPGQTGFSPCDFHSEMDALPLGCSGGRYLCTAFCIKTTVKHFVSMKMDYVGYAMVTYTEIPPV